MICCPSCGHSMVVDAGAGLTERQAQLLNFIVRFIAENGCSPSLVQMRDEMGFKASSNVHRLLHELRDRKRIAWEPFKARSVTVLQQEQVAP